MSETEKDELIDAQKQVIGILFEVIKRLQTNNDLDEEYFQIITDSTKNEKELKRYWTKEMKILKLLVDY
uniref:Uncharacterized protein n=1 Tax=uncultured marine thaumarchaeote KM3_05_H05 TaxID=1455972 RepID=A0A075G966_9ARCH|nr:hypothetical protein [uncultured marine thaumarchaeote KM3_05_H05]